MLNLIPSDATQRIITFSTNESRQTLRCTNTVLRDAILQWEYTTPIRLFKTIRHDSTPKVIDILKKHTNPHRVLYLECIPEKEIARQLNRMQFLSTLNAKYAFYKNTKNEFISAMKTLLHTLEQCSGTQITRWDFTCIVSKNTILSAQDPDGLTFRERLIRQLPTSLERICIRLCMHNNSYAPESFGETPFMSVIIKEALPLWTNLTHFTLTDITFDNIENITTGLVHIVALALVRDKSIVDEIISTWENDNEYTRKYKASPLHALCLENICIDQFIAPLFWLILGDFPPKNRIELKHCGIDWPEDMNPKTGTIFNEELYEEEGQLTICTTIDTEYDEKIFKRMPNDPRVIVLCDDE